MMKKQLCLMAIAAVLMALAACSSKKVVTTSAFHSYDTECLGMDMDGMQTLRVWGTGLKESEALENALKKAVYEITFTGIAAGQGECNSFPVVSEANARTKYEKYFNDFFEKGGKYKKYVKVRSQQKKAAKNYTGDGTEMVEVIVIVDRPELKRRFEKDKILEKPKKK